MCKCYSFVHPPAPSCAARRFLQLSTGGPQGSMGPCRVPKVVLAGTYRPPSAKVKAPQGTFRIADSRQRTGIRTDLKVT